MTSQLLLIIGPFAVAGFVLVRYARRYGPFGSFVATLVLGTVFFKVVFPGVVLPGGTVLPGIAMVVTGATNPLPVPAMAFWSYLVLIAIGALLVASNNDASMREFARPLVLLLRGDFSKTGRVCRHAVLWGIVPLFVGAMILSGFMPSARAPLESRLAHPTISYDPDLVNPFRHPDDRRLADYAAANHLEDLSKGEVVLRFKEAMLQEGRHLYGKNCSPCHGGKADGTGVIARGLRLRPADFTDPGTIATLVEGYAFRRIMEGGIGLPAAGSPWDSAMPRWKKDLSEQEAFKILLAEYDLAGVSPRVPEKAE